jgi:hypothetical protein
MFVSALIVYRTDALEFFYLRRSWPWLDDTKSLVKLILGTDDAELLNSTVLWDYLGRRVSLALFAYETTILGIST